MRLITWGFNIAKSAKRQACRTFPEKETRGLTYAGSILCLKWDGLLSFQVVEALFPLHLLPSHTS